MYCLRSPPTCANMTAAAIQRERKNSMRCQSLSTMAIRVEQKREMFQKQPKKRRPAGRRRRSGNSS